MPELPSLEIFKKYFDNTSLNQQIINVDVKNPEILTNTSADMLKEKLVGYQFTVSRRYGKYLFCRLENDFHLILHFGMTGYLHYFQEDGHPYIRVLIQFDDGFNLGFVDMRKFGKVGLTRDVDAFIKEINLGPDALQIDQETFIEKFKKRKGLIKPLLINQNFIAGIGNLYADEILYQSGINPLSRSDKLGNKELRNLFREMRKVLKTAVEYQDKPESLPPNFLLPHRHRDGACPGGGSLNIIKVGGRTTYYCPQEQELYQ
jgi:formamidopyrimidine-DNA glycosylase